MACTTLRCHYLLHILYVIILKKYTQSSTLFKSNMSLLSVKTPENRKHIPQLLGRVKNNEFVSNLA